MKSFLFTMHHATLYAKSVAANGATFDEAKSYILARFADTGFVIARAVDLGTGQVVYRG